MGEVLRKVCHSSNRHSDVCQNLCDEIPFSSVELQSLLSLDAEEEKLKICKRMEDFINARMASLNTDKVHSEDERKRMLEEIAVGEDAIKKLEAKDIPFPQDTIALKRAIQAEFKARSIESNVYILSELLDITDTTWTNAIEGFLNTQRFYLIVEPKYYNVALQVYSRLHRIHSQGIINTRRIPQNIEIQENSLASFVISENSYAKRFIDYILGGVICSETLEDLENYDCAITKDCMLYKNFVARKLNPKIYSTPFIGKDAIAKQLKQYRQRVKELKDGIPVLKEKLDLYDRIENIEKRINFPTLFSTVSSPNLKDRLSHDIKKTEADLEELKRNPDIIELEEKIEAQN